MKTTLVIPTNRPDSLKTFLAAWQGKGGWDDVIIVEDAPERSPTERLFGNLVPAFSHYSHAEIKHILGDNAWIISRKDSACRCFGFLAAYHRGADAVITLDDDCHPHPEYERLVHVHQRITTLNFKRWISSVPNLRVRGLPYQHTGYVPNVVASVGLWSGVPDLDARTQLEWEEGGTSVRFTPPCGSCLVPHGQYVPVSGMNLYIRRDALPLFYFPLMGEGQPYSRFDDIWAGIIAKKCLDALGWHVAVGEPFVHHVRASDPYVNLKKEEPGVAFNEEFWKIIDGIPLPHSLDRPATGVVFSLAYRLRAGKFPEYVTTLGKALQTWARLFLEPPAGLREVA